MYYNKSFNSYLYVLSVSKVLTFYCTFHDDLCFSIMISGGCEVLQISSRISPEVP